MALGDLVTRHETGGVGTAAISNTKGDKGGASYGKFQLSYNMGSLKEYLNLLNKVNPEAYNELAPLWGSASKGKSGEFGKKWMELAGKGALQDAETQYANNVYMKQGLAGLKDQELANRIRNNPALQEAFLSTTVQHGATGGANVWNRAAQMGMTDADIIKGVYAERGRVNPDGSLAYFSGNSPKIQRSVANRFKNEVNDILGMLGSNQGNNPVNPNSTRPSAIPTQPQGFINPLLAQSSANSTVQMVQPQQQSQNDGFVGYQVNPQIARAFLNTVNENNTQIARMASGQGLAGLASNLNTGVRYNPVGLGFGV